MQVEKEKTEKKSQSYYCEVLNQKFSNYATYASRISTKKYQKALETYKSKSREITEDSSAKEAKIEDITVNILESPTEGFKKKKQAATTLDSISICLFTNCMFESFEKNLEQMKKNFGFFILDEKCCIKKEELIKYLAKVIHTQLSCIYCHQRFKTADSVQKHIISKQHALMNSEYFGQYERFFDFREENRKVAQELQERFKNVRTDNEFTYMIKNKAEGDKTEIIAEKGAAETNEEEWEDDENNEIKSK